ncbi:MAG: hypothetical protein ABSD20_06055 [Terriglobales bacterium]|jgi:hypothetical protein
MSIKLDYLPEPNLQFGEYFEHQDAKTGLADFGPFGLNLPGLHREHVKLGFIGTRESVSECKQWIERCAMPIESEKIRPSRSQREPLEQLFPDLGSGDPEVRRYEKILNRDFVGFNSTSSFKSSFVTNARWEKTIPATDINTVLSIEDKESRVRELIGLFACNIKTLAQTGPSPDIIILALTPEIVEKAHSVRISGNFYLNFRRAIKAEAMQWNVPIQLLQRRTVTGKGPELQEAATRAWNFCTAQYYKADGVPWRPCSLEPGVCFAGISFYVAQERDRRVTLRSSVAQAFDYLGQGLVLRGDPFEWDEDKLGRSPHLPYKAAYRLMKRTLEEYLNVNDAPPRRVVVHKTSEFWGPEHFGYNELEGLQEGIKEINPRADIDFITLRQTHIRLFREGKYPPLRGTLFTLEEQQHFLFTMGYIPFLGTYPGVYVPEPWQITDRHGSSSPRDLLAEVLALTKMNVNNCSFADGTPITLSFSQKIGEIMKHIPEDGKVQPNYKFYM